MNDDQTLPDVPRLDANTDLETVLSAWNVATQRLERTHEALQAEVCRLTDELEIKNRELARKNRLADLGQMASHIAHEVRNNLVPVTLYLSLLRRRVVDDLQSVDVLDKIESGFTELDATVNDLLSFTADRDPHLQSFPLGKLVDDIRVTLAPQFSAQKIKTVTRVDESVAVVADRDMLRRAVLNLTLNALDAMPDGGQLSVDATAGEREIELTISDTGPGLSEDAQHRAFEPFYTTKRGGTGLGLAIVHRIVEVHGGNISCENRLGAGASFTLCLPNRSAKAAA